jgi:hypothetical protein
MNGNVSSVPARPATLTSGWKGNGAPLTGSPRASARPTRSARRKQSRSRSRRLRLLNQRWFSSGRTFPLCKKNACIAAGRCRFAHPLWRRCTPGSMRSGAWWNSGHAGGGSPSLLPMLRTTIGGPFRDRSQSRCRYTAAGSSPVSPGETMLHCGPPISRKNSNFPVQQIKLPFTNNIHRIFMMLHRNA